MILEPGEEFQREDGSMGVNYNVKRVFDISQTSSKVKPVQVHHDMRLLLKALLNSAPCEVEISTNIPSDAGALFNTNDQKIYVRQGMEGHDIFRYLTQALTQAQLAKGDADSRRGASFTAFCTAYTLCKRYGVDTQSFNFKVAPGAIREMDAQGIRGELAKVRDCANQISMDMSKILEKSQKERSGEAR